MLQIFKKGVVFLSLLLLALIFFLIVGVNSYLIFSNLKEQLAQRLQASLGKKPQVGLIYFLPWSGLHVKSITLVDSMHPYSLEASSINFGIGSIVNVCKNNDTWVGELQINQILLDERPVFKKITIEIIKKSGSFSLNPLIASFFDGTLQGTFLIEKNKENLYRYEGSFSLINASLQKLLSGTSFQKKVNSGFLQGTSCFSGIAGNPQSFHGSGTLQLVNAEFKTADYGGALSRLFSIEELQLLKLRDAKTSYTFSLNSLHLDSARLQSNNMLLTTHGTISFQGEVALDAELILSGKYANYMKSLLPQDLLSLVSQQGNCNIPFKIFGSFAHLKSNFLEKISLPQIPNNLGGALQQLLNSSIKLQ
ncbi:MAG: AsmA-like C-terminal region-containing protein [Verrucomicrobiae bacterium]|jgi:hypothetical protein|nr:AsmA-like C-terminal region-containing protein [Verrucomicrobiae bacterium]